jgi:23S rRNA pseudouridine2605 synthase
MTDPDPAANPSEAREGERIAKLLARAGVASRREVERMIAEGRVRIGETLVTTPATVLVDLKGVSVDGKPVSAPEPPRLFAFHKPAGLLTAERDMAGRPTIYTALRNALPPGTPRLMPVGRLDLNTEGLLLLTNDGELKRAMELPSSGIPRTYRARTFGAVTQTQLEDLIEGISIDGMHYGKIDANLERSTGRNQWIELTLTEGKNREVRRVLEHLGLEVSRLLRTTYGPFALLDLPRGQAVEIRAKEVDRFRESLKLAPVSRSPNPAPAGSKPPRKEAPPRKLAVPPRKDAAAPRRPGFDPAAAGPDPQAKVKRPLPRKPRPSEKLVDRPRGAPGSAGRPGARPKRPSPRS